MTAERTREMIDWKAEKARGVFDIDSYADMLETQCHRLIAIIDASHEREEACDRDLMRTARAARWFQGIALALLATIAAMMLA